MSLTPAQVEAIRERVADAAATMLLAGYQGTGVDVPELGEEWTISREELRAEEG